MKYICMKYALWFVLLIAVATVFAATLSRAYRTPITPHQTTTMATSTLTLTSPAFTDGASIPPQYTCDGANAHIPLAFSGVPAAAKSLALIMDDPDVPRDRVPEGVYDHWVLFNIPPKTAGISDGAEPGMAEDVPGTPGANGAGRPAYTGPCPPDREHRYFIRLYALDTQLALKKGATKAEVLAAMDGHILAEAALMGRYDRPR